MKAFQVFKADHGDFVRDVAYDYYGKRLATCSSDGTVKIWEQTGSASASSSAAGAGASASTGDWAPVSTLPRSNAGAINRVVWAHPEFGQVIATCSGGRVVAVYEEFHDTAKGVTVWQRRCHMPDSTASVESIAFAPRHLGLRLASAAHDGLIRVYECSDPTALTPWPLAESFDAGRKDCSALAWNPHPFEPAGLAVAAGNTARVWEFNEPHQRWSCLASLPGHGNTTVHDIAWAPALCRSFHLIATASADGVVRVFRYWPRGKPQQLFDNVDVALAAGVQIADNDGAGDDAAVNGGVGGNSDEPGAPTVVLVAALGHSHAGQSAGQSAAGQQQGQAWRVSWDAMGTTLASSGEDGAVRLWAAGLDGHWGQVMIAGGPQF